MNTILKTILAATLLVALPTFALVGQPEFAEAMPATAHMEASPAAYCQYQYVWVCDAYGRCAWIYQWVCY